MYYVKVVLAMALSCTVSAAVADLETLEEIRLNDRGSMALLQMRKVWFLTLPREIARMNICHQTKTRRPKNEL